MPKINKRKRLFTPGKNKIKYGLRTDKFDDNLTEVDTARGRLKGALLDVLDPPQDVESDDSSEATPVKSRNRKSSVEEYLSDEEVKKCLRKSPVKPSYVLKLFDRSVDLSQFRENSPLYPICRAWMANNPKALYKSSAPRQEKASEGGAELPGPRGPPGPRLPDLLDVQKAANKDNINLDYWSVPPPPVEQLLRGHAARWAAVRQAWLDHAVKLEARYEETQKVLNRINIEYR